MRQMISLKDFMNRKPPSQIKSLLISGGSTKDGEVILPEAKILAELSRSYALNIHVGLVSSEMLESQIPYAHTVSQDLHGDDETLQVCMGLEKKAYQYQESYMKLRECCRVIPHILLGLNKRRAIQAILEYLQEYPPAALVLLVLIPLGRKKEDMIPLDEIIGDMSYIREKMPETPLVLGCMRPGGQYRKTLDREALSLGINGIVNPAIETTGSIISRECCALWEW